MWNLPRALQGLHGHVPTSAFNCTCPLSTFLRKGFVCFSSFWKFLGLSVTRLLSIPGMSHSHMSPCVRALTLASPLTSSWRGVPGPPCTLRPVGQYSPVCPGQQAPVFLLCGQLGAPRGATFLVTAMSLGLRPGAKPCLQSEFIRSRAR